MSNYAKTIRDFIGLLVALAGFAGLTISLVSQPQQLHIFAISSYLVFFIGILWFAISKKELKQRWRFLSLVILFIITIPFFIWVGTWVNVESVNTNGDVEPAELALSSQVAVVAWNASGDEEYLLAFALTKVCVESFGEQATQMQSTLITNGEPSFAIGTVSDIDARSKIFSNGMLNEVAACYIIQGNVLKDLNCPDQAKEAYDKATQFPHARVFDPGQDIFWSPSEFALQQIADLSQNGEIAGVVNNMCQQFR